MAPLSGSTATTRPSSRLMMSRLCSAWLLLRRGAGEASVGGGEGADVSRCAWGGERAGYDSLPSLGAGEVKRGGSRQGLGMRTI